MRYFIGFLVTMFLIILVIILIVGGGGKKAPVTSKPLQDYASTDALVQMTIDGPINATQDHRQIRISVNKNQMTLQKIKGYDGAVQETRTFQNTENSFENFLRALAVAGFTKGNADPKLADQRSYCPLGTRTSFDMQSGGHSLEHFWATSCNNPKTYEGSTALTIQLFQNQIPDYNNLVSDYNL